MTDIATHTPGPWVQQPKLPHQSFVEIQHTAKAVVSAASLNIARVTVRDTWFDEQMANARLIAAAPELLAALELADAMLSGANMNASTVERKVRAAIAKAKGEKNA